MLLGDICLHAAVWTREIWSMFYLCMSNQNFNNFWTGPLTGSFRWTRTSDMKHACEVNVNTTLTTHRNKWNDNTDANSCEANAPPPRLIHVVLLVFSPRVIFSIHPKFELNILMYICLKWSSLKRKLLVKLNWILILNNDLYELRYLCFTDQLYSTLLLSPVFCCHGYSFFFHSV